MQIICSIKYDVSQPFDTYQNETEVGEDVKDEGRKNKFLSNGLNLIPNQDFYSFYFKEKKLSNNFKI